MREGHFADCLGDDCACEEKSYIAVFFLMAAAVALELFGALHSHSTSLLADSFHVLGDIISVAVSWFVARSVRSRKKLGLGGGNVRAVGGYINAALLGIIAAMIFGGTLLKLYNPPPEIFTGYMALFATMGAGLNYAAHLVLHKSKAGHVTHKALDLHVLSDLWQSVAIVAAGGLISLTGFLIIDPLLSLLVAVWMFVQTEKIFAASRKEAKN